MQFRYSERRRDIALAIFALAYGIYFFRMTRYGLHSWFSEDDLLNIYYSWSRPLSAALTGAFSGHYRRPLTELLLKAMYFGFGFHPGPFNVVRLLLCGLNVVVLYWFVSSLTRSREAGILAVLLTGFHPALSSIYYDSGMLFDVLAFLFYYSAFTLYIHGRHTAWVLLLFLCALGSKEISVSFPLALLLYEIVIARRGLRAWLAPLLTGLMTLGFIAGLTTGPGALSARSAYSPRPSVSNYLDTYAHYAGDFIFHPGAVSRLEMGLVLAACIALALLLRNRILLWASLFNLVAVLPVAFIPPRNGFAFFVPLAGWAVYASVLLSECRQMVTRGNRSLRAPSQLAVAAFVVLLLFRPETRIMNLYLFPLVHQDQFRNRDAWNSLRSSLPAQLTKRRILAIHEPFDPGYSLYFMLQLGYSDRTIEVDTVRLLDEHHQPVSPEKYEAVIDYTYGKFILLQQSRL
jgi:hypothetical protein